MFMTLCHTLVGYLISFVYISLKCVFLREEAELPTRPPPPSPDLQTTSISVQMCSMYSVRTYILGWFKKGPTVAQIS